MSLTAFLGSVAGKAYKKKVSQRVETILEEDRYDELEELQNQFHDLVETQNKVYDLLEDYGIPQPHQTAFATTALTRPITTARTLTYQDELSELELEEEYF